MANYCATADLYDFGLPRGAIRNPGRLAGTVSIVANSIELEGHGFGADSSVSFRAEASGSLPSPLISGTAYFALPLDDDHFSVATSAGGAAVDLTTIGSRIVVIAPLPITSAIEYASALIDDMLPAHVVPLTSPYPPVVRVTCAELAAGKLSYFSGGVSKSLTELLDLARKRMERWAKGVPIRGTNAPKAASLSTVAVAPHEDSRGWSRYGGTI